MVRKFANRSRPTVRRRQLDRQASTRRKIYLLLVATASAYMVGFRLMAGYFESMHRTEVLHPAFSAPQSLHDNTSYDSPVIIFTCHRPNYLSQTLEDLYRYIPRSCSFGCPIIVSEDGEHPEVEKVILEYKRKFEEVGVLLIHIRHQQVLRRSEGAYQALSKHYGWALSQVFNGKIHPKLPIPKRVIILEEDLHIAPDFFSYFASTAKILDEDSSLLAVSAFSDNGHLVSDPTRLLRSDFFPGLGWMMTRALWKDELEAKWPDGMYNTNRICIFNLTISSDTHIFVFGTSSAYWDDWLRDPAQRKGRQIIRPEISRTYHFGFHGGASNNQVSCSEELVCNSKISEQATYVSHFLFE